MYTAESILQRNLVVLEYVVPKEFKQKVYSYIDAYHSLSLQNIIDTMNVLADIAVDKKLDMSMQAISNLSENTNSDDIILIAQLNALATLVALKSVDFEKPLSWWIDISSRLVDVSYPSNTIH